MKHNGPIAVFDSGMGGVSVLKALVACMPQEDFLFFGDSLHAPYGEKSREEVIRLSEHWCDQFRQRQAKAIVIACNTATSAAIETLRKKISDIPIIGLEPAVKPAALYPYPSVTRPRILVMATPVTLAGEKYRRLIAPYQSKAEILSLPALKIVRFVENGETESAALSAYLNELLEPVLKAPIDGIVLGCTHFPFVKKAIRQAVGPSPIFFDGAEGAARQTQRLLKAAGALNESGEIGTIRFENSDPSGQHAELSRRLFACSIDE